jgi:hypothetical protein
MWKMKRKELRNELRWKTPEKGKCFENKLEATEK